MFGIMRAIVALFAALLLEGEGGKGGKGGEGDGWSAPPAEGRKFLSDLIDERIDAAFERWLEKAGERAGSGSGEGGEGKGGEGKGGKADDPPAAERRPGFLELVFGSTR